MDLEIARLWGFYWHIFPQFTPKHITVYRLLWRIESKTAEALILETGFARATVFKILGELVREGLAKKIGMRPTVYAVANPAKAYSASARKLFAKLKKGRGVVSAIVQNATGLSNELYLIKRDGGQQRLFSCETNMALLDEEKLLDIRRAADLQLNEAGNRKLKAWVLCR